jgi:erythromycin esterase-like protein
MVVVGFDFYHGSFQAVTMSETGQYLGLGVHSVGPPPDQSYEDYFGDAGMARMILDLRGISFNSPETSWLAGPRAHRSIGAVFMPSHPEYYFYVARMPEEYDVVIYIHDTSAAQGLPYNPPSDW